MELALPWNYPFCKRKIPIGNVKCGSVLRFEKCPIHCLHNGTEALKADNIKALSIYLKIVMHYESSSVFLLNFSILASASHFMC